MTTRQIIARHIDRATSYDASTVVIMRDKRIVAKLDPNKTLAADGEYYLVGYVHYILEDIARASRRADDIYAELAA